VRRVKMRLNPKVKIREENGFYLLINLDEESIIKGNPSFYKINDFAKEIIDELEDYGGFDEISEVTFYLSGKLKISLSTVEDFIEKLIEGDILI